MEKLDGHRLKVTYNSAPSFKAGYGQQMRRTTRDHSAAFFWESDGVTMQHVELHFLHAFGVVGQLSKNITLDEISATMKEAEEPALVLLTLCRCPAAAEQSAL